jgi:hypothetical protein
MRLVLRCGMEIRVSVDVEPDGSGFDLQAALIRGLAELRGSEAETLRSSTFYPLLASTPSSEDAKQLVKFIYRGRELSFAESMRQQRLEEGDNLHVVVIPAVPRRTETPSGSAVGAELEPPRRGLSPPPVQRALEDGVAAGLNRAEQVETVLRAVEALTARVRQHRFYGGRVTYQRWHRVASESSGGSASAEVPRAAAVDIPTPVAGLTAHAGTDTRGLAQRLLSDTEFTMCCGIVVGFFFNLLLIPMMLSAFFLLGSERIGRTTILNLNHNRVTVGIAFGALFNIVFSFVEPFSSLATESE